MAGRHQEVFTSEDDEEFIAPAAIAKRKPGRPPKNQAEPYPKRILTRNEEKQPEVVYEAPKFRDEDLQEEIERVLQGEDPEPQDIPMSESKKERKLKVKKQYEYNVWEDIKSRPANINIKQLAEMNPHIRQQIREGISNIQTKTEVVEARKVSDSESSSGDEKHTSAYAECVIKGRTFKAVIDTGAGPNLIAKHTLDELGWGIEEPTNMTINTAMGEKSTPQEKVKDISVQVGGATIPVRSMIVTSAKSYDLILGNEWINKANANIDITKGHMMIEWKGKKWRVPISSRAPKFEQVKASDSEQEAFMVTTEKKKKTQKRYNPRQRQEVQQYQEIKPYGVLKKKKKAQLPEVMVNAIMEQVEKKREEILKIAPVENRPSIRLKRMEQGIVYPQIQQQGSAGIDLPTSINVNLTPGESAIVPTGWAISILIGHVGLIKDRSLYAKERIMTFGGVIDHGYH